MSGNLTEARAAALAAVAAHSPESSDAIQYSSDGKVAVAGDAANWTRVAAAARQLGRAVSLTLMEDDAADFPKAEKRDGVSVVACRVSSVAGHLGNFVFKLRAGEGETERHADAILDLREKPLFARRVLPPGCFRPNADAEDLRRALESLAEMRGVFQKPKYFRYDESLCAHRGGDGCSLCVAECPAAAIASAGNRIEVDPHLCQGCGACVAVCPGGAMRYAHPPAQDILAALREGGAAFRARSGKVAPLALFHAESDSARIANLESETGFASALPLALEETGAAGIEIWMCALAYGFGAVGVFAEGQETRKLAEAQAEIANGILSAMNFPKAIRILPDIGAAKSFVAAFAGSQGMTSAAAKFAPDDDKRSMFFAAMDFLLDSARDAPEFAELPAGSPFGEARIDKNKCTLCMACAGACPASALRAGGDSPRLLFAEENCLQCGLCESACPEDAVSLRPRILFSRENRRTARVVNEEAPFCCVSCGKPFATARMIARVEEKLRGHWMYQDDAARRRLRLCEDCRAAEMFGGELIRRSDRNDDDENQN